ncbi:hypothetical protein [Burkholderia gladioli]|uniref:hypothetical protein n=1 Tax=Burkholderia gladioli TaxID=28095 RepID=UPI001641A6F5|nr:hypothetical protein [Burkholderia gladioli]
MRLALLIHEVDRHDIVGRSDRFRVEPRHIAIRGDVPEATRDESLSQRFAISLKALRFAESFAFETLGQRTETLITEPSPDDPNSPGTICRPASSSSGSAG